MAIGYACLVFGVPDTGMKRCLIKNATRDRLSQLTLGNLQALDRIIDYTIKNEIKLFRISSDLIPFSSNPINDIKWWKVYEKEFQIIANKIKDHGIRISMHPGQYTVLNSPDRDVVNRAVQDLNYHGRVLDSLGEDKKDKIILHIGGVYKNKEKAMERFITNYDQLSDSVKNRLVIENDDKSYNISDVLEIGSILDIPVVFDNLHHQANPSHLDKPMIYWIDRCAHTWHKRNEVQKIHYSQQNHQRKKGAHSNTIKISEFMDFYLNLGRKNIDIMLEVKDKNLSAIKCINCTSPDKKIKVLEEEWNKYKYSVLGKSATHYNKIRKLLKDKNKYPGVSFYQTIEDALENPEIINIEINGIQHVWGYFKNIASTKEKEGFLKKIEGYQNGKIKLNSIKKFLWKMANKYEQQYLLNSCYFILRDYLKESIGKIIILLNLLQQ